MDQALGYNGGDQRSRSRSPGRRPIDEDGYAPGRDGGMMYDSQGAFGSDHARGRRGGRRRGRRGGRGRGRNGGLDYGPAAGDYPAEDFGRRDNESRRTTGNDPNRNFENTIFVGNLSFDTTSEELRNFFQPVGEIVSAEIVMRRGRHRGMGTVEFTNTSAVDEAIRRFNDVEFMGRTIFVKQDRPPPEPKQRAPPPLSMNDRVQSNQFYDDRGYDYGNPQRMGQPPQSRGPQQPLYEAFILNLPYSFSWQDLKDLFRQAGDVQRADIELDYQGYSRGFGMVFYATEADMLRAIDMFNGFNLEGRVLEVREGRSNQRGGEIARRGSFQEAREPLRYDDNQGGMPMPLPPQSSTSDAPPQSDNYRSPTQFTEGVSANGERSSLVFCNNLPVSTSANDLYELFESLGRVSRAELKFDSNGLPTGEAVVDYDDIASADLCVSKLNNYNYGGNDLSVSYAQRTN